MRTVPLPQCLLGRQGVCGVWRAGAERRTENVETCETPSARAPAAARVARPGPAGPKTRPPGILPAGWSPSQPSGSLSSGPRFSPQALWGRHRAFPAARRSSASPRLLLGAGVLSQRRLFKASFPARDDPRPLRTFLPRETPFPEATAWRPSPPPAPRLPQTPRRCRLCPNESQSGPPALSSPDPLGTLFSLSPAQPRSSRADCCPPASGETGLAGAAGGLTAAAARLCLGVTPPLRPS